MRRFVRTTTAVLGIALGATALPARAQQPIAKAAAAEEAGPVSPGQAKLEEAAAMMTTEAAAVANAAAIEASLKAALQADPELRDAEYNLGVLKFRLKEYDQAKTIFQGLIAKDPSMASAHAMMGAVLARAGDSAGAMPFITKAIELDRTQPVAHNFLAAQALSRNEWPEAISHARQALVEDPDNMNSYLTLAISYFNMDMLDLARFVCLNALAVNDQSAPLHNMLGLILLKKDEVRGALVQFNRALAIDPDTLSYSDFQSAFDHFDRVVQLQPNNIDAKLSRAVALRGLERFDEAQAAYGELLAANAQDDKANFNLCILYNEYLTDYQKALDQCQRYFDMIPAQHPEKDRMRQRIEGIKATIEALAPQAPAGG
jgi:tetratricopeptide (TPR) repeat protein